MSDQTRALDSYLSPDSKAALARLLLPHPPHMRPALQAAFMQGKRGARALIEQHLWVARLIGTEEANDRAKLLIDGAVPFDHEVARGYLDLAPLEQHDELEDVLARYVEPS